MSIRPSVQAGALMMDRLSNAYGGFERGMYRRRIENAANEGNFEEAYQAAVASGDTERANSIANMLQNRERLEVARAQEERLTNESAYQTRAEAGKSWGAVIETIANNYEGVEQLEGEELDAAREEIANASVNFLTQFQDPNTRTGLEAIIGPLLNPEGGWDGSIADLRTYASGLQGSAIDRPDADGDDTPAAFRNLQLRARAAGLVEGTPEYQAFMRNGGRTGRSDVEALAGAVSDMARAFVGENKATRDTAGQAAQAGQNELEALLDTTSTIMESPSSAFGPRGQAGRLAAATEPFLGSEIAGGLAQLVAGASPEEINQLRTSTRTAAVSLITEVTGDDSGRYTDREQAIAASLFDALDNLATQGGLMQAMSYMISLKASSVNNDALRAGMNPPYWFVGEDGQISEENQEAALDLAARFRNSGFSMEQSSEMVRNIITTNRAQLRLIGAPSGNSQ